MDIFEKLPGVLLPWYEINKRCLPWRQDKEPYHIWVSEIMLQQTRVEAVKGYYTRFLQALPTVQALAACDDELLHKLWEGLGYYNRVRNMKKAAQCIVADYAGVFPGEYEKLLALPGIGEYTAGAIASICFDLPVPAVDGNVLRVISRLTNDDTPIDLPARKAQVRKALLARYPQQAGAYTQALMELGATLCGPNRAPDCAHCPCRGFCEANRAGTACSLPVKSAKKARREEAYTVFILSCNGEYAVEKRAAEGLLASLWQFPNVPGTLSVEAALAVLESKGLRPREILRVIQRSHVFTHVTWQMQGVYIEVAEKAGSCLWRNAQQIDASVALPTAFRQFWEEIRNV